MKILVIEPSANGHRFQYLDWTVRAFLQDQHEIVIATSQENISHPLILKLLLDFPSQIRISSNADIKPKKHFLIREVSNWNWFRTTFLMAERNHKFEFVFTSYMDHYFYSMAFLGSPFLDTPFSGIIMGPTFHHREVGIRRPKRNKDFFEKKLFVKCFRSAYLKTVFTIDPFLKNSLYSNQKLCYLPDPSSVSEPVSQSKARQILSLDLKGKAIMVFGAITNRKGLKILLQAVAEYDIDLCVLVVGRHDSSTLKLLGSETAELLFRKNKLKSINEYAPPNIENAFYSATDFVWLGYVGHYGMSGVLVKAASCDKDILACKEGVIGLLTETHQLGLTTNTNCVKEVAKALTRLMDPKTEFNKSIRKEFSKQHQLDKFNNSLIKHCF